MLRRLYHGSDKIIRSPKFGAGNPYDDYGLGFYCTDSSRLAGEWAVSRYSDGFVNKYTINDTGLRIIDLTSPQYCILHWLSALLNYREFDISSSQLYQAKEYIRTQFDIDYQNCDCIVGWRADNCNFTFAQNFINGAVSYRELRAAVTGSDTGKQFVLKSNRAFDRIVFDGYKIAWSAERYPSKMTRDRAAMERAEIAAGRPGTLPKGTAGDDLFITQLIENAVMPYDSRLI